MAPVLSPDKLGPTVCIGEILVEIVATTQGEGFVDAQPLYGPYPSGAPAIFIDQCGRIGGSAAMIGAVGDDDFGRVNVDRLKRDGVDVSAISVDPDFPTEAHSCAIDGTGPGTSSSTSPSPLLLASGGLKPSKRWSREPDMCMSWDLHSPWPVRLT